MITTFKTNPYFFYTENDLHAFLYSEIYDKLPLEEWLCKTRNGKISMLMHKEYPIKERYSARALKKGVLKGARALTLP